MASRLETAQHSGRLVDVLDLQRDSINGHHYDSLRRVGLLLGTDASDAAVQIVYGRSELAKRTATACDLVWDEAVLCVRRFLDTLATQPPKLDEWRADDEGMHANWMQEQPRVTQALRWLRPNAPFVDGRCDLPVTSTRVSYCARIDGNRVWFDVRRQRFDVEHVGRLKPVSRVTALDVVARHAFASQYDANCFLASLGLGTLS